MSVRIKPCHGCFIRHTGNAECDTIRAGIQKSIAGAGLRSATFHCAILARIIKPGARVIIRQPVFAEDGDGFGGEAVFRKEVKATITSAKPGGLFACVVDKGQIDEGEDLSICVRDKALIRFRKTMRHTRIVRFLDEPMRKVCDYGNPVDGAGNCDSADGKCACKDTSGFLNEAAE
jgi:hypothetical protein